MQASQEFFGLIVFTLHPFGCVPQLKHTFLDSSRPLCCLTLSLSRFFVQFSRCNLQPLLQSDLKIQPNPVGSSNPIANLAWWARVGSNHRPYDYQSYALSS